MRNERIDNCPTEWETLSLPPFRVGCRRPWPGLLLILALYLLPAGCALLPGQALPPFATHLSIGDEAGDCGRYFAALDQAVHDAGVHYSEMI